MIDQGLIVRLLGSLAILLLLMGLMKQVVPRRVILFGGLAVFFLLAFSYLAFIVLPAVTEGPFSLWTLQWALFGAFMFSVVTTQQIRRETDV